MIDNRLQHIALNSHAGKLKKVFKKEVKYEDFVRKRTLKGAS